MSLQNGELGDAGVHLHAVAVPIPAQGHMNPLMRFCKTLARHHGFTITFVNMAPMQQRLDQRDSESRGATSPSPPQIRVTSIPMPPLPPDLHTLEGIMQSIHLGLDEALEDLIRALSRQGPPVTCLISDVFVSASTQRAADKLMLPRIVFVPTSQSFHLLLKHMSTGLFPLNEAIHAAQQGAHRPHDAISIELPGLPRLSNRDLVVMNDLRTMQDETDVTTRVLCNELSIALADQHGLNTFVVNSFPELEEPAFHAQHLTNIQQRLYPIGPLLEDLSSDQATNTSLLTEDQACLSWLDTKAPHSVLYISFGSSMVYSKAQVEEFLLGLEASSQTFLLVFRPDLVADPSYTSLPEDFLTRTRALGYVVRWAPQLQVLAHPSVGGFVTHCGWNSTIEAIANGVPMLCWPYLVDQPLNAKYIVDEWKIGLRVEAPSSDSLVKRDDIELLIKTLMQSSKGEEMREKAKNLSSIAKECHLATRGSSYKNIQAMIKSLHDSMR